MTQGTELSSDFKLSKESCWLQGWGESLTDGCAVSEYPLGFKLAKYLATGKISDCCVPESSASPTPDRVALG